MPTATERSAQEVLGGGFGPRPSLFTPVAFGDAMTIQDRYRATTNLLREEQAAQQAITSLAQDRNTYLRAERDTAALQAETSVLDELDKLDPLSSNFERDLSQFQQMASVSPAVGKAMEIKLNQRSTYNTILSELSELGSVTDLSDEELSYTESTARDLLIRGDLSGVQRLMSTQRRMARTAEEDRALRNRKKELRQTEKFNIEAEKRAEARGIGAEKRAEARGIGAEERAEDRLIEREGRAFERSLLQDTLRLQNAQKQERGEDLRKAFETNQKEQAKLLNDVPLSIQENSEFKDFFGSPMIGGGPLYRMEPVIIQAEAFDGLTDEQTEIKAKELGIDFEQAKLLQNVDVPQLEVDQFISPEEAMVRSLVQKRLSEYIVGDGKSKISGFSENVIQALQRDPNTGDELASQLAAAALNSELDTFLSIFLADEMPQVDSEDDLNPATLLEMMGFNPKSSRARNFLEGLYEEAQNIQKLANLKREIPLTYPEYREALEEAQEPSGEDREAAKEAQEEYKARQKQLVDGILNGF